MRINSQSIKATWLSQWYKEESNLYISICDSYQYIIDKVNYLHKQGLDDKKIEEIVKDGVSKEMEYGKTRI